MHARQTICPPPRRDDRPCPAEPRDEGSRRIDGPARRRGLKPRTVPQLRWFAWVHRGVGRPVFIAGRVGLGTDPPAGL